MTIIIPPDTKIAPSSKKGIFRAESAVIEKISSDQNYHGSSLSWFSDKTGHIYGVSQLDNNRYAEGSYYNSVYPINRVNNVGIHFPTNG